MRLQRKFLMLVLMLLSMSSAWAWDNDSLSQLRPIADQGNAEAQYFVGMLYSLGIGGASRDPKLAFTWFQKSAEGGDPLAAYKIGCYYAGQYPDAVAVDPEMALRYKSVAAKAGYALAQTDVGGTYYQRGEFLQAQTWWQLAAAQGYPPAANNLSTLYYLGKGVEQDMKKAYLWFKIAYPFPGRTMDAKAKEHLQKLAKDLTTDEIAAADKMARRSKPNPSALTVAATYPKPRVEALLALLVAPPN